MLWIAEGIYQENSVEADTGNNLPAQSTIETQMVERQQPTSSPDED